MLLHVVKETDAGIVVHGAKYETAAAYANQAFVKPTIANWGDSELSDYAVGFIVDMGAPGHEAHLPHRLRRPRARSRTTRSPTASTRSTRWSSSTTSRSPGRTCSSTATPAPPPTSGPRCTATAPSPSSSASCAIADMMIGTALFNARQTGLEKQQAVQEKLAELACLPRGDQRPPDRRDRRGRGEPRRPADAEPVAALHRPRPRLLATAGDDAHRPRAVRRPDLRHARRRRPSPTRRPAPWLEKFYTINEDWEAEDRRKLLAFARDLLNSDYAGHRLTFQLFAQSPPFAHLAAVYRNFDWDEPLRFVQNAAGLSERVLPEKKAPAAPMRPVARAAD